MKDKSFIKHLAAIFFSAMIICLAAPYNLGYATLERSAWLTIVILSVICFVLIEAVFFQKAIDKIFNVSFKKALLMLNLILVALIFIHFLWQIRNYKYMWFAGSDLSGCQQMFWNTVNGGGFFYDSAVGSCALFSHLFPLLLIMLPFYFFCQHVYTLFFMHSVFFCYACLPLFLIASKRLNNITSIIISIGFLFYPFIVGPTLSSVRETTFIAFFMLFAFYFFEERRFYLYLLFLLLTMMARETVPLTCFMFAIYAIIKRRPIRWIVVTIILTASYFFLYLSIQKMVGYVAFKTFPARFIEAYGYTGSGSIIPAILNKLSNPRVVIASIFNIEKIKYLYKLFSPCALILPFLSVEILFIMPHLLMLLLSDNLTWLSPLWHHSVDISIFLWVSTIFAISKVASSKKIAMFLDISKERLSLAMVVFISLTVISCYHTWYIKYEKMSNSYYETVKKVASFIPSDTSVCAPSRLLPFLCEGRYVVPLFKFEQTDYIVIDRNIEGQNTYVFVQRAEKTLKKDLAKEYEVVFDRENIMVYKKIKK